MLIFPPLFARHPDRAERLGASPEGPTAGRQAC